MENVNIKEIVERSNILEYELLRSDFCREVLSFIKKRLDNKKYRKYKIHGQEDMVKAMIRFVEQFYFPN